MIWLIVAAFVGLQPAARADVLYDFFGTLYFNYPVAEPMTVEIWFVLPTIAVSNTIIQGSAFQSGAEGGTYAGDFTVTELDLIPAGADGAGIVTIFWDWLIPSPPDPYTSAEWWELGGPYNPFTKDFLTAGTYYDIRGDAW